MNFFDIISLSFMSALSSYVVHPIDDPNWRVLKNWTQTNFAYEYLAESESLVNECKRHSNAYIKFPKVILGFHDFYLDGQKLTSFGDSDALVMRSLYGTPIMKCKEVLSGTTLSWHARTTTKYFAVLIASPAILMGVPIENIFSESLNLAAAGTSLFICIFTILIFWGKVSNQLTLSLFFANLFLSGYFIYTVSGLLGLEIDIQTLHKLGDIGLWLGMLLYLNALRLHGFFGHRLYIPLVINISIAIFWICVSNTGDSIQLGISLPFIYGMTILFICVGRSVQALVHNRSRKVFFETFSLVIFVTSCLNDILNVTRIVDTPVLFSVGIVGGMILFVLAVNEKIAQTYSERDALRLDHQKKEMEVQHARELSQVALHVAHDIRSPLAALSVLTPSLNFSSSKEHLVLRTVISRINHIAENLLEKYRNIKMSQVDPEILSTQLLGTLIPPLIAEKIYEFRRIPQIKIELDFSSDAYGLLVKVSPTDFERVISNLVNNAVEALPGHGVVRILISSIQDVARIEVTDTGKGIPPQVLEKIGEKGFTFGKPEGSGFGLSHAFECVVKWCGTLKIQSVQGRGSNIVLSLPLLPPPSWLLPSLSFNANTKFFIIDDDASIFQAWITRFSSSHINFSVNQLTYLSDLRSLTPELVTQYDAERSTIYLVDYEFDQSREIDTIQTLVSLGIESKSVLVTNHAGDMKLQQLCIAHKIQMIPKDLLGIIPLLERI